MEQENGKSKVENGIKEEYGSQILADSNFYSSNFTFPASDFVIPCGSG
jgi:hypothetical protein